MLKVENLSVSYGAIAAVKKVDIEVREGELVTLLGANGAGKTTTLLAIAGVLRNSGKILFRDREISHWSPEKVAHAGIAMVPETRDVFADLTVLENLRLGAFTRRKDTQGCEKDLAGMFELFPILEERRTQPAGTLSGGEQQQLVIARALMSRPQLLLLDEPSMGLAPAIVDKIFDYIARLKQTGLTILLVEQNARKALTCADRAYVLALGEVAASGSAREISESSDLAALYLGG
ncbi:MAG: ABC transporter ATP-binding protein [Deltaproteobacteria bacterium]|nr:ABC transporter ATP-binding protein [Deltaproteobacteria bacterium]